MKTLRFSLATLMVCGSLQVLDAASTPPMGYVTITCLPNSDTIVGLPMRQNADFVGTLSGDPEILTTIIDPGPPEVTEPTGEARFTVSGSPNFTVDQYAGSYYIKFKDTTPTPAAGDGQWFAITANTADTITVDLNGGSADAVSGAAFEVLKFWTLDELFPPGDCTTDPATTGNAIVASTSQLTSGRRTTILLPDLLSSGINLSSTSAYYVNAGVWKKVGSGSTDFGSTQFWPDNYFTIRHPSTVNAATSYTVTGEVETASLNIPLATNATTSQDNFIGLPRPVDVTLNNLNLGGTSAFMDSTSQLTSGRRDLLLVFDNAAALQNKSATAVYYFHNSIWKKVGGGSTDFGTDVIPAGGGFMIRKYQTGTGATVIWKNTSPY